MALLCKCTYFQNPARTNYSIVCSRRSTYTVVGERHGNLLFVTADCATRTRLFTSPTTVITTNNNDRTRVTETRVTFPD